ncbi:MAG: sulfatase-like hydrolase/transferase [Phycisphaerales bacterium]|nr:sulfatase-like hydrolase/transferase [Phycisphaerales bacterium]
MLTLLVLAHSFLLVVLDDVDYRRFGFVDGAAVTPVIDQLAAEGVLMPNCQAPMAVCRPALGSLLVGQRPDQTGVAYNSEGNSISPDGALAITLSEAGYGTFLGGKYWEADTGPPSVFGFGAWQDATASEGVPTTFGRQDQQGFFDFLDSLEPNQPFYAFWAPLLPHTPFNPPPSQLARVPDANQIWVPPHVSPTATESIRTDFGVFEHLTYARATQLLYANTAWVDSLIGDALDGLEARGRLNDTIVIVCGDNGWAYGGVSKSSPYELGLRAPLIVAGPGIVPQTRPDLVSLLDIVPTIADFAGVASDPRWAGRSLRPALEGGSGNPRSSICGVNYDSRGDPVAIHVRDDRWKLIYYLRPSSDGRLPWKAFFATFPEFGNDQTVLFDLQSDPEERTDLAGDSARAQVVNSLRAIALKWYYYEISAAVNPCPSDVTFDGVTDLSDLAAILSAFGGPADSPLDLTRDGVVDLADLAGLLASYGVACDR